MGKLRDIASIVVICFLAIVLLASSAQAKPASVLLQEGLYAEEIEGDLDAAIKIYEQIVADKSADSRYAAQAMYRLGLCYQKKQDYQMAKATFEKLIARFPKEKSIIEKVQPLLDQMSVQDPAALMPPETLVYLELGSPGKQIETILNMLKGTPLANPLNLISAPGGQVGGRSPGDMMGALMNPAMITEFKKIRGVALGLESIHSNNPPGVAVLYLGESDALRGMFIAGLGMMFQAGEPVEGMQTQRMGDIGGAAYDDNVIIIASPIDRLMWCVKQYKGVTNEPTLASQNKAFAKLSRKQREQNAVTIWADVDRVFPLIREELSDDQRRLIGSIGDIGNVDEFTTSLSLEQDGLAVETNIGFKDGHSCLAYDLIRTPNITGAGFEAVPAEAVALVSFALGEAEGTGAGGARKVVKKLTGLDIGRELFANIEQITLFALPPTSTSTKNVLAESISPVVLCLGLAVTSHNAKRTHQLFTQLLTLTDLVMGISKGEELADQRPPAVGEYRIGEFNGKPAYCYMGQAGKSTILALSPEVLQVSLSAVKSGKSALSAGPLHEILSRLSPDTSKLVAVNAAGAIQLANVHICESHGMSPEPEKNYFSQLFGQLAQACDETYVVVRTDEKANNFGLNVDISGLPDFGQVFPLVAQIPEAMENPMLPASRPRPADKAMVKPAAAVELIWEPGRDAAAHKVYFGTSIDKLPLLGEVKTPRYDKPTPERGVTYHWRVDEVQADGSVVTGDIWSFSTGKLVAWWKFDETSGGTASDSSGNNYHGTAVHGDPVWKPDGKFGGCLDFNERYGISIPKEVFDGVDKAMTISVWVKGDKDQEAHSNVILQAGVGRRGRPYVVTVKTDWKKDGGVVFKTGRGEAEQLSYTAGLDEWAGRWNHYAFVKDADEGSMRIYVNGRLVAEQTGTTASMAGVGAARIGIAPDRFGDQYIGKLDDLRIYNYAFSAEEIQELYTEVSGFRPEAEVELADIDESPQAALIDFDTGKLVRIPDRLREAGGDEAFPWVATRGLDVGAEFAGDEYGLFGIDVIATRVAPEQWDKITPAELRKALAAEPIGIQKDERATVMPVKGEYSPTFAFRTREGGTGVLQIVDADRSKKMIRFRYKMLKEKAERASVVRRQVFLPDADTPGVNVILDLASGELLPAGEGVQQLTVFREMGKGDLAYDRALICLRAGKAKLLQTGKLTGLKIKGQIEDSTAYQLPGTPCRLVVTTAEGDAYEVKVLSVEGDEAGIHIEYWKSREAAAEFTGASLVQPDLAKALGLSKALSGPCQGIGTAIENDDPATALLYLGMVIEHRKQFEGLVKGTGVEASVTSGFKILEELRDALRSNDIDRAKILFNLLGQIGSGIEWALEEAGKKQEVREGAGTGATPEADLTKALRLAEGLYGLYEGIVTAIENNEPDTALFLVEMLIEPSKQFEPLTKGTAAEPLVKSGLEALPQLRDALKNKDIDRAKSLLNVLNKVGPAIESALEEKTDKRP